MVLTAIPLPGGYDRVFTHRFAVSDLRRLRKDFGTTTIGAAEVQVAAAHLLELRTSRPYTSVTHSVGRPVWGYSVKGDYFCLRVSQGSPRWVQQ